MTKHPVELVLDRIEKWFWFFVKATFGSVGVLLIAFIIITIIYNVGKRL